MVKRTFLLFVGVLFLSGCSSSGRMQRLMTLKNLAKEQKQIGSYVEEQDQKFEKLLARIQEGELDEYVDRKGIKRAFGDPVYVKPVQRNGQAQEQWLYRYATQFFGSEKVYLYFDESGKLMDWSSTP